MSKILKYLSNSFSFTLFLKFFKIKLFFPPVTDNSLILISKLSKCLENNKIQSALNLVLTLKPNIIKFPFFFKFFSEYNIKKYNKKQLSISENIPSVNGYFSFPSQNNFVNILSYFFSLSFINSLDINKLV